MSQDVNPNIVYYPKCYCKECNGFLNLTINPNNFSISSKCQDNKTHDRSCIYFKTFKKYYLEKEENFSCINCSNIEKNQIFQCLDCKKKNNDSNYCAFCLFKDFEKNNHKNFIAYNKNKCKIHNMYFSDYCKNCRKNICIECYKNSNHVDHDIFSYIKNVFNEHEILELEKQINEKSEKTINLIVKIEEWFREIKRKTYELIQNLKDELDLYKTILLNYNRDILNYRYVQNFIFFKNFFQNSMDKNENLIQFENKIDFKECSIALINVFTNLGNKREDNNKNRFKGNITKINNASYKMIKRINNELLFCQNKKNKIYIGSRSEYTMKRYSNSIKDFTNEIKSFTLIPKLNLILICISKSKTVKIIKYNLDKNSLINITQIIDNMNNNSKCNFFNKCIMLSEKIYVTSDNDFIKIWKEENNNFISIFNAEKKNSNTCDLLSIDDNFFISCQYNIQSITVFDSSLKEIKKINNIDCINSNDCLFKLQEKYIIIHCMKGIGLFSIETKELIQYFVFDIRKMCFDGNNYFYSFDVSYNCKNSLSGNIETKFRLIKFKFIRGSFELEKEDEEHTIQDDIEEVIYLNSNEIYIKGENCLYIWEKNKE